VRLGAELEFSNSLAGSYKVEMKDLKERAVRGGFAKLCAQVANLVIRVGSLVILARLLNPTDFGLVAMVTAVTGLLNLFRDFGLSTATVQQKDITEEQISTLFWINLIIGVALAIWSASGYVAAFMRAANAIYDIGEGRPIYKTLPVRVGTTIVLLLLLAISALAVVLTGGLAQQVGKVLGIGQTAVDVWDVAKWPVLLLVVSFMFSLLYWAAPNVKQPGFRWLTPGGLIAVLVWIAISLLFAFYVANFSSYNKTYGALAGVVVFLVWLWISNLAVLLGAEVNAELERGRRIEAGHPSHKEPFVEPRDTTKLKDTEVEAS